MQVQIVTLIHHGHMDELISAFKLALEKRGANVKAYNNLPKHAGDLNIYLIGVKKANVIDRNPKKIHILCQLEELWNDRSQGKYRPNFRGYNAILELYEENTKMRAGKSRSYHFPLGYSKAFGEPQDAEENLDAYFFGSKIGINGERRRWPYNDLLKDHGFDVIFSDKAYGQDRTNNIRRSKVNLFVRHSQPGFYCPLRSLSIQCKGKFLLNEVCQGGYGPYVPGKHFIEFDGNEDLIDKMRYYTEHTEERKDFAAKALEDLKKNHRFEDYLMEVLGGIL